MVEQAAMPTDVSIITTYRCCMKCKMCDIWRYPTDIKKEIKAKELEILPNLKFVNITGGEPFVRNDLQDIVEVAFKKAPRVVISTSGYQVESILAMAERFPKIGIRVSIEGLSTINDFLRGRDSGFDRGLKTLLGLRRMGIKDIGFGITVSNNNSADMLELYELAKNLKMEFATAAFHNSYYFHKEDNKITNEDEVTTNFYELIDRLLTENSPKSWFRAFFNLGLINYVRGNKRFLPCEAGTVNFFIEPYGEVYPCNGLEEHYWKEDMGNIRDYATFEELWFSEKAQQVRALVKTCPKNCWMVGTAAPVMKKYLRHTAPWVVKHKIKSLLGKKFDRNCVGHQFDVGQSPLQGDLRGGEGISSPGDGAMGMEDQTTKEGRLTATVLSNEKLTENVFLLEVERNNFLYDSGQNASIGPHLVYHKNRDYTFYSAPQEKTLKFLIREVADGEISPLLMDVKPGDKVDVVGPYGDFQVQDKENRSVKHLFVATGVGIGPFRSFITAHPDLDYQVIHGIRHVQETVMAREIDPERYVSCVTVGDGGGFKGRVTDYLNSRELEPDNYYYLCGNPHMLRDISDLLVEKGVPEERIQVEPYYAY